MTGLEKARLFCVGAAVFNAVVGLTTPLNWFALLNAFSCGAVISAAIGLTYLMHMEQALAMMAAALRSMGDLQNGIVAAWAAENDRREPKGPLPPTVH